MIKPVRFMVALNSGKNVAKWVNVLSEDTIDEQEEAARKICQQQYPEDLVVDCQPI